MSCYKKKLKTNFKKLFKIKKAKILKQINKAVPFMTNQTKVVKKLTLLDLNKKN